MHQARDRTPGLYKLGKGNTHGPSSREAEGERLEVQGYSQLLNTVKTTKGKSGVVTIISSLGRLMQEDCQDKQKGREVPEAHTSKG